MAFNVRLLRTAQGLSQEQLALESRVAAPYVSRIERATVNPTISVMDRLAAALDVGVDSLLKEPPAGSVVPTEPLRAGRKRSSASRAKPRVVVAKADEPF